jgi:hypothetical protein
VDFDPDEVERLYVKERLSMMAVSRQLGITVHAVRTTLGRRGVKLRSTRAELDWTAEIIARAVHEYVDLGFSMKRIAHRLHTSDELVRSHLLAAGVEIRKRRPSTLTPEDS